MASRQASLAQALHLAGLSQTQCELVSATLLRVERLPRADRMRELTPRLGRWTASRKTLVLSAITHGVIEREEALAVLGEEDELSSWESLFAAHGPAGLATKKTQLYRCPPSRSAAPRRHPVHGYPRADPSPVHV